MSVCPQMQSGEMFLKRLAWTAVYTEPKPSWHRDLSASGPPEVNSESQRKAHMHQAIHRCIEPQTFKNNSQSFSAGHCQFKLGAPEEALPLSCY